MGNALCNYGFLCWLFCAGAIMLNINTSTSGDKQSPNVKKLVDESVKKKAVAESTLLNENPLMAGDIPEALGYIKKHTDYTSYHLLLAVRKYYPSSYKDVPTDDKVAILCSALKTSTFLNDWGYLTASESFDGESSTALLELGKVALKTLEPILDDSTSAPLFGSQEATLSSGYNYRRKDFAYRYASLVLGESPVFHADPNKRNKDIEMLKAKLKKDAK